MCYGGDHQEDRGVYRRMTLGRRSWWVCGVDVVWGKGAAGVYQYSTKGGNLKGSRNGKERQDMQVSGCLEKKEPAVS